MLRVREVLWEQSSIQLKRNYKTPWCCNPSNMVYIGLLKWCLNLCCFLRKRVLEKPSICSAKINWLHETSSTWRQGCMKYCNDSSKGEYAWCQSGCWKLWICQVQEIFLKKTISYYHSKTISKWGLFYHLPLFQAHIRFVTNVKRHSNSCRVQ